MESESIVVCATIPGKFTKGEMAVSDLYLEKHPEVDTAIKDSLQALTKETQ